MTFENFFAAQNAFLLGVFVLALITGLVDLKLLPEKLRTLEAI